MGLIFDEIEKLKTERDSLKAQLSEVTSERNKLSADLKHRIPEFIHFGGTGEPQTPEGKEALDKVADLMAERDRESAERELTKQGDEMRNLRDRYASEKSARESAEARIRAFEKAAAHVLDSSEEEPGGDTSDQKQVHVDALSALRAALSGSESKPEERTRITAHCEFCPGVDHSHGPFESEEFPPSESKPEKKKCGRRIVPPGEWAYNCKICGYSHELYGRSFYVPKSKQD